MNGVKYTIPAHGGTMIRVACAAIKETAAGNPEITAEIDQLTHVGETFATYRGKDEAYRVEIVALPNLVAVTGPKASFLFQKDTREDPWKFDHIEGDAKGVTYQVLQDTIDRKNLVQSACVFVQGAIDEVPRYSPGYDIEEHSYVERSDEGNLVLRKDVLEKLKEITQEDFAKVIRSQHPNQEEAIINEVAADAYASLQRLPKDFIRQTIGEDLGEVEISEHPHGEYLMLDPQLEDNIYERLYMKIHRHEALKGLVDQLGAELDACSDSISQRQHRLLEIYDSLRLEQKKSAAYSR